MDTGGELCLSRAAFPPGMSGGLSAAHPLARLAAKPGWHQPPPAAGLHAGRFAHPLGQPRLQAVHPHPASHRSVCKPEQARRVKSSGGQAALRGFRLCLLLHPVFLHVQAPVSAKQLPGAAGAVDFDDCIIWNFQTYYQGNPWTIKQYKSYTTPQNFSCA